MKAKSRLYKYTAWVSSTHLHVASPFKNKVQNGRACSAGPSTCYPSMPSRALRISPFSAQQDVGNFIPQCPAGPWLFNPSMTTTMCVTVSPTMTFTSFRDAVLVANQYQADQNGSQYKSCKSCQTLPEAQLGVVQFGQAICGTQVQVHTAAKG